MVREPLPTRGPVVDLWLPKTRAVAADVACVAGGAAVTAVAAQISIPWQPVPFTLQTMAVFATALALGARRGVLSQLAYLTAGLAGAPVFANGLGGPQTLFGPTGGYLLAFLLAAAVLGTVADRGWDRKPLALAGGLLVANLVVLGLGTLWLATFLGLPGALAKGTLPFLPGELVKSLAVAGALPATWWLLGRRNR